MWQVENRNFLNQQAGTKKGGVISKVAGEEWAKLPAEEKAPFKKRAEDAMAEYRKALAAWKARNPDDNAEEKGGKEAKDDKKDEADNEEGGEDCSAEAVESPPKKVRKVESPKSGSKPNPKAKGASQKGDCKVGDISR